MYRHCIALEDSCNWTRLETMQEKQKRPKFLNLTKIHLPVTGVTSIAHRISGAVLFLSIPFFIFLFKLSLQSEQGFASVISFFDFWVIKLLGSVLVWAFSHHLFAGIRHLLLDIAIGESLPVARKTAWIVNVLALLLFLYVMYRMWL